MKKFTSDLTWTYAALAVMAASGFLINIAVGLGFGAEGLGAFTQALAVFVIVSQVSTLGFHLSTFKHVAEFSGDRNQVDSIVSSGLLLSAISGLMTAILLFVAAGLLGAVLDSEQTGASLRYLALALPLFSVNKVLLSTLNALQLMRRHATGQILRYTCLLLVVGWAALTRQAVEDAALCFVVAELAVFAFNLVACRGAVRVGIAKITTSRLRECWLFGFKGFWSGMAAELNIRTDILVIGLFMGDAMVGVYALVSVIFEGLFNAIYAVRMNLNPQLVTLVKHRDWSMLNATMRQVFNRMYPAAVAMYALIAILFLPASQLVFADRAFAQAYIPLLVILAPLALSAGLLPFDQLLLQAGHAGHYSATLVLTFLINLGLNLVLVPPLGLTGAAAATGVALLTGLLFFLYMAHRVLGWDARVSLDSVLRANTGRSRNE